MGFTALLVIAGVGEIVVGLTVFKHPVAFVAGSLFLAAGGFVTQRWMRTSD